MEQALAQAGVRFRRSGYGEFHCAMCAHGLAAVELALDEWRCTSCHASGSVASLLHLLAPKPAATVQPVASASKRAPVSSAQIWRATDLLALDLPEPRWAVDGLLTEGLALLAGRPKLGKSWLALSIAIAVSHGGRALGHIPVEPGDVLHLALEDGPRRLQSRIRQVLNGVAAPARLHLATPWPRFDQGGVEELDVWLARHPDARLVVVETFAKARPSRQQRGDAYAEDYAAAGAVKELGDRHHSTIVAVMHARKPPATAEPDFLDAVLGTSGLTGAADTVLLLRRERGKAEAVLAVTGRDVEERELALTRDPNIGWVLLGDAAQYRLSEERSEVLRVLREAGRPLTPTEAAPLLRKTPNTAKYLLWQMSRDGQLRVDGHGRYSPENTTNPTNRTNPTNSANRANPVSDTESGTNRPLTGIEHFPVQESLPVSAVSGVSNGALARGALRW